MVKVEMGIKYQFADVGFFCHFNIENVLSLEFPQTLFSVYLILCVIKGFVSSFFDLGHFSNVFF